MNHDKDIEVLKKLIVYMNDARESPTFTIGEVNKALTNSRTLIKEHKDGEWVRKDSLPSVEEIQEIVILNTLEVAINYQKNQELVFRCCGKPIKDIELKGSCPYCGKDKTEVIRRWKFYLAQALHKRIRGKNEEIPDYIC